MRRLLRRGALLCLAAVLLTALLTGCGAAGKAGPENPPEIPGMTFDTTLPLQYADCFSAYSNADGYSLITVTDGRSYLVVPEGGAVPDKLPAGVIVLRQPLDRIYLAASSAMALFDAMDGLDAIRFSGTAVDSWYVENAVTAMNSGAILFAGKYSEPDYEKLLGEGCDLAVESTMILHAPEVQEKLEQLGIPVFIDCSSYESHPLGRTEWIKLYGVLLGRQEQAEAFFRQQASVLEEFADTESTGKTVAYFFINTAGQAVVRRSDDNVPQMIRIAGGEYIFKDLKNPNANSTSGSVTISMEEFYAAAKGADYLVYNATIDSPIGSVDDLLDKSGLFAEFEAVKNGNVFTTDKYLYQATDIVGELIADFHTMVTGGSDGDMTFLKHVD